MSIIKPEAAAGVVIACCDSDLHLAIGAAESVRFFMPYAPICLVYDGLETLTHIQECFDLTVIRKATTRSPFLRAKSYGYGITKMVAFWESPFDTFLYLDSDALCWGDLLSHYHIQDLDMIVPSMAYSYNYQDINRWFFDTEWLKGEDPDFDASFFVDRYFCTGTYFARRGIFDIELYEWLLNKQAEDPSRFFAGEMGILNYMIFSSVQHGRLRISHDSYQYVNSDSTWQETFKAFPFVRHMPHIGKAHPKVLHYAGYKPSLFNQGVHGRPMRFFRIRAKQRLNPKLTTRNALLEILIEDYRQLKESSRLKKSLVASYSLGRKACSYVLFSKPLSG